MSTVSNRPVGFQSRQCVACGAALFVAVACDQPLCRKCERGHVLFDIHKAMSDARQLRDGTGIFAGMSIEERNEQLASLGLPPLDSAPKFPGFRRMSSDRLIRIVSGEDLCVMPGESAEQALSEATAELAARLESGKWEPTAEEREEIETRDEIETRLASMGATDTYTPAEQAAYAGIHEDPERFDGLA